MSLAAVADRACGHCGLPCPAGADFCCDGCRTAHEILVGAGLERYYALAAGDVRPARGSGRSYDELDDPSGRAALLLEGIHCAACVWLIEKVPSAIPGVLEVRLDVGRARADVVWDPARTSLPAIARFLDAIGYPAHRYAAAEREAARRREDRALLVRIAVAGAAAGNVMLLAAALYAGMFSDMGAADVAFFRWASMLVSVPVVGWAAMPFFRGAWAALRLRAIHLDVPIALGIAVALGWGAINTIRGTGEIYFDSIAMLVFFLLVARLIQARQQRRAAGAAELLLALTPSVARRLGRGRTVVRPRPSTGRPRRGTPGRPARTSRWRHHRLGGETAQEVSIGALAVGDRVEVRAGETIPVDGVIATGRSALDLGLLTGESRPVEVGPGDQVAAGTVNLGARLEIVATATGEATRIGTIARTVEAQARRRAPIVRFADRVAARFVVVAVVLAAITAVTGGLDRAMALLIVTCPCALGLATPMTFAFAIGRAAQRGVLIKGGDALERLARPGLVFLDKTGTLTEGAIRVVAWRGDPAARPLAAALEAESAHPLARAIAAGPREVLDVRDVRETTGGGIEGVVAGRRVRVGSPRWIGARSAFVDELAGRGVTPVVVEIDGAVAAVAGLADPLRADAASTIERLQAAGWRVELLSGDDPRVVARVAAELGVDGHGGVSPEGKLDAVRTALVTGPVVMVGDGVNDAAALAAATCGVAVHGGAEAAASVADVVVTGKAGRGTLGPVAELLEGARHTLGVVHRNLAISLAYNLVGATLAVTGVIHPLLAAVMMPVSSLTVVSSAAWSRAFREGKPS